MYNAFQTHTMMIGFSSISNNRLIFSLEVNNNKKNFGYHIPNKENRRTYILSYTKMSNKYYFY